MACDDGTIFTQEVVHLNGLQSGGRAKYAAIRMGEPPIELDDQTSPAANLLRELFMLLQRHYRKTKFDELRLFLPCPKAPPKSPPPRVERAKRAPAFPTPYQILGV